MGRGRGHAEAPRRRRSIGELARLHEPALVARYGKIGRRLYLCARGEDDRPVDPDREAKSISSEITLDQDLSDADALSPILWRLAETAARRMKKAGLAGEGITLKLKTADFRIVTRARHLKTPTQSAEEMLRTAEPLLAREADSRAFRLIGIGAHELVDAAQVVQDDLCGRASPPDASQSKTTGLVAARATAPFMTDSSRQRKRDARSGSREPAGQMGRWHLVHQIAGRGRQGHSGRVETRPHIRDPHQASRKRRMVFRFRDPITSFTFVDLNPDSEYELQVRTRTSHQVKALLQESPNQAMP